MNVANYIRRFILLRQYMKKLFHYILSISWLLFFADPAVVRAQPTGDLATRYQNAKQLLTAEKYTLSMAELQPLLAANQPAYTPGALYLYATAATKAKKFAEAEQKLTQLQTDYPEWPNLPDAIFLAADLAFQQQAHDRALTVLASIEAKKLAAEVSNMKFQYLSQISDKTLLQNLVRRHPDDAVLGRVYADKLVTGWYTAADEETLKNLVKKFDLPKSKYTPRNGNNGQTAFNVAVLLPFPGNSAEAKARKNQFVTDLYGGMLLARDSLAKNQIQLNLYTYDAPADTNQLKTTLQLPEMAGMDLIIGPVYKSANKIITRYAQQYNVNSVNPLSEDGSLVKNNPRIYLYESAIATRARQSAAFAIQNFPLKTAVILAETTKDDTAFANAYQREYVRLGGQVTTYRPFNPRTTSAAKLLAEIDLKTTGHLVILANTPAVAIYTLSKLEQDDLNLPLITYPTWLAVNQLSLSQFNNREIYFIYPKFIDTSLPGPQQFRRQYTSRFYLPPSVYAYSGFEMLYYFGQTLQKYGRNFNAGLQNEGPVSGVIFPGIGYAGAHDNQYVPLLKMNNLELIVVNPVFR